jgi:protein-L-isoaspartate(D-aspartate) O-methyltransferase
MIDDNYKLRGLRNKLVKKLREKGIHDGAFWRQLAKFRGMFFFENALIDHAYQDKAFPIGEGQTISQPYTVAFQSEKLEIRPGDRVLEIGPDPATRPAF